jgi:uncharacterized protein (TIGR03435 family)
VRRHDNLIIALHNIVEAIFWFHPLVWWIRARLIEEQESACDQEVLRSGVNPLVYAEAILAICSLYLRSPLECTSGIGRSNLKKRVEAIMTHSTNYPLSSGRKVFLTAAAVAMILCPIGVGMLRASAVVGRSLSQSSAADNRLSFEVVSVKRNNSGERGGSNTLRPGRYSSNNVTLRRVVNLAYSPLLGTQIVGGPDWIDVERFDIEAKSEGNPTMEQLRLMVRSLLADRFKLRVHTETKELPAYALVIARNDGRLGPQLRPSTADCSKDSEAAAQAAIPAGPTGRKPGCGFSVGDSSLSGKGGTMDALAAELSLVGRQVVDRTGLNGSYEINLEWSPDADPTLQNGGPSIFTALQEQLGLKLEAIRAPQEVLVIDGAERPSEN